MRDVLTDQDFLYTVVERSAAGQSARVVGSLVDYIYAPQDREAAIERMAAADTRIVSLTITEGGYFIDEGTGEFVADHPDIQHDLRNPTEPSTSIGIIAEALDRRWLRALPAFTVMSCDKLQGNGDVVQRVLLAYAGLRDPALQQWIAGNVAFPNSMVDRITPATKASDILSLPDRFALNDGWPSLLNPSVNGSSKTTFATAGLSGKRLAPNSSSDVAPYEIMKIRLLNGSHLEMAYLGALSGITFVHEVMADPLV